MPAHFARNCARSAHQSSAVEAAAKECPTPIVMHKRIAGDHSPIPRRDRPQTVVIILKAPNAKSAGQHPDRVDHFTPDQKAEPDTGSPRPSPRPEPFPNPTQTHQVPQCSHNRPRSLRPAHKVRRGPTSPTFGSLAMPEASAPAGPSSPPRRYSTTNLFPRHNHHPLIRRGGEAAVEVVDDHPHVQQCVKTRGTRPSIHYRPHWLIQARSVSSGCYPGIAASIRPSCA